MEIVPRKRKVAIFGGMSIAILIVVRIVLRNQRGRVVVVECLSSISIATSDVDLVTPSSKTHNLEASK